ncbi:MAG TPA: hypothetical protein VMJ10_36945 [Kofleriaceae bacterium]|nr:hypothetical protein [Kofleriaceae bacterium]
MVTIFVLAACSSPPPIATEADAARAHVELAELAQGRHLLIARCSGCHTTPLPSEHTAAEWPRELGDMAERAHLTIAERDSITRYLVALSPPGPAIRSAHSP